MRRHTLKWFPGAVAALLPLPAIAAETAQKHLGLPPVNDSLTGDLLRMLWGLCIVIALLLAIYWVVRKKFALPGAGGSRAINIVEMRPLTGRKALALVEVEGKKILLGIAEQQITSLATFDTATDFATALYSEEAKLAAQTQSAEEEVP